MKKATKTLKNNGFAWSSHEDMEKLAQEAENGWHLTGFTWGGFAYKLEKGAPEQLAYSLDCYRGTKGEYAEYLELFEMSGWKKACTLGSGSAGTYTIFKAPKGTPPLYSDSTTLAENYHYQGKTLLTSGIALVILGIFFFILIPIIRERGIDHEIRVLLSGVGGGFIGAGAMLLVGCTIMHLRAKKSNTAFLKTKLFWIAIYLIIAVLTGMLAIAIL
ncbi:MAG: DUF2812 domain-containing protein [Turicibacter sp.]|nr:DUF2812 domain-containing protein [Turicibacter sp.]